MIAASTAQIDPTVAIILTGGFTLAAAALVATFSHLGLRKRLKAEARLDDRAHLRGILEEAVASSYEAYRAVVPDDDDDPDPAITQNDMNLLIQGTRATRDRLLLYFPPEHDVITTLKATENALVQIVVGRFGVFPTAPDTPKTHQELRQQYHDAATDFGRACRAALAR